MNQQSSPSDHVGCLAVLATFGIAVLLALSAVWGFIYFVTSAVKSAWSHP